MWERGLREHGHGASVSNYPLDFRGAASNSGFRGSCRVRRGVSRAACSRAPNSRLPHPVRQVVQRKKMLKMRFKAGMLMKTNETAAKTTLNIRNSRPVEAQIQSNGGTKGRKNSSWAPREPGLPQFCAVEVAPSLEGGIEARCAALKSRRYMREGAFAPRRAGQK